MLPEARRFLNYEFATLALVAGMGTRNTHAPIYKSGATEAERQHVKDWLRRELLRLSDGYITTQVDEQQHIAYIERFAVHATTAVGRVLHGDRLRFGVAQKILNLYLKYLWVTDQIAEPVHCPIDSRVAAKAGAAYKWTVSDSLPEYQLAIAAIRAKCRGEPLARWELREFEVGRGEA